MFSKLKVFDCYSGIGGFSYGLQMTGGFETVAFCEINPYCQKVLHKHWSDVPCFDDVKRIDSKTIEQLPPIDCFTAGFPCQPFSIAGNMKGSNDNRNLWSETIRVIRLLRPRYIILENVPNIRTIERGYVFGRILADLAQSGYDAEWQCISARSVGAPHKRERVFLIAYSNSIRRRTVFNHVESNVETRPDEWKTAQGITRWSDCQRWFMSFMETNRLRDASRVQRDDDGISRRLDRLRGLGNAVVPQVVSILGYLILNHAGSLNA